jgi:CRP-like cAMP-binding protein
VLQIFFIEDGVVEVLSIDGFGEGETVHRVNKIASGGVFGESAFFLDRPHTVRALALRYFRHVYI